MVKFCRIWPNRITIVFRYAWTAETHLLLRLKHIHWIALTPHFADSQNLHVQWISYHNQPLYLPSLPHNRFWPLRRPVRWPPNSIDFSIVAFFRFILKLVTDELSCHQFLASAKSKALLQIPHESHMGKGEWVMDGAATKPDFISFDLHTKIR